MIEVAVVVDTEGGVVHWHLPPGRTSVAIPDTRDLWQVLWAHRETLGGIAHSHPGSGNPAPSWEDLTTFAACEAGLGRRLDWWIITEDQIVRFRWTGPDKYRYRPTPPVGDTPWLDDLRTHSYGREP